MSATDKVICPKKKYSAVTAVTDNLKRNDSKAWNYSELTKITKASYEK